MLLADTFHFPKPSFDSMEALLTYLFEAAKEKPMILVLDEYPYLREVVQGMDSVLFRGAGLTHRWKNGWS